MTRIFERAAPAGSVARAMVVGVGAYPNAKPAFGAADGSTPPQLHDVPDLLSAATSAALFTDWLIVNADALAAPLASIDLLLNVNTGGQLVSAYEWKGRLPSPPGCDDPRPDEIVDPPTTEKVKSEGRRWKADLDVGAGNVAIFFICGHGAILGSDNIVFLSDLNADSGNPWGALINIQTHASAFKVMPSIQSAFFFVDACSELVLDLVLQNPGVGAQFASAGGRLGEEKVAVIAAAVPKRLAYEGTLLEKPAIRAGRFTQCLLQGLKGAAVREMTGNGQWSVHGMSLYQSLQPLYNLRVDWQDRPFEPNPPMLPANAYKIVDFPAPPTVPIRIRFVPDRAEHWSLELLGDANHRIDARVSGPAIDWLTTVPASLFPYTLKGASASENKTLLLSTIQSKYSYEL
jgi:hypothetical protein